MISQEVAESTQRHHVFSQHLSFLLLRASQALLPVSQAPMLALVLSSFNFFRIFDGCFAAQYDLYGDCDSVTDMNGGKKF